MKRVYFIVCVVLIFLAMGCTKPSKKVLLVFSYHAEYPWVEEETRGVEEVFANQGVLVTKFYMDTKRKTSLEWKEKAAKEAVKRIGEFQPDLVMVFDDNACDFVATRYIGKDLPFVFCGMNNNPEQYGFPAENITGLIEREFVGQAITLLKVLAPDVERVGILSDDSPTSKGPVSRTKKAHLPVEISEICTTNDFDVWKTKVKEFQTSVDAIGIFLYHTLKGKGREDSLPALDVLEWTLNNSKLPEFSIFDFTVKDGALCGVTQSGYDQGKTAAEIAIKILDGASPSDIPIKSPGKGVSIVNETRAEELSISIPKDTLKGVQIIR